MNITGNEEISFGIWCRKQRLQLDLSRQALADQVGCAEITLRRIEAGTLKPSKELAHILLEKLGIPEIDHPKWIPYARGISGYPIKPDEPFSGEPLSNLPIFLTTFIGREKEQAEIIQIIQKHRLVTLIGPGGVGKTRLAAKIGELVLREYSNGIWMANLASQDDPTLVPQAMAVLFGLSTLSDTSPIELLVNYLRTKNALLILDDCEHLLQACAQLTDVLLKQCPNVKILATSREPLKIVGEAVYSVPSLGVPSEQDSIEKYREIDSIRLFEERAQLAQSDFLLTSENIPFIVQICRHLDGIPLAIELAAGHVGIFSAEQIAARLNESFNLLTSESNFVLPRQQTIRNSIDWSWNLLSDLERIILCRLSVFSGSWTLDAAETVCGGNGIEAAQVAEFIFQLAAKSLVTVNQDAGKDWRYRLHETICQYASEKMGKKDERYVRTQHLKYFLALSAQAEPAFHGPQQLDWIIRMNKERDNFRSALDWAGKTDVEAGLKILGNLRYNFDLHEGLDWISRFITRPESHNFPRERAKVLLAQANFLWVIQQFEAAQTANEESLTLFRACGDGEGEFECLMLKGSIAQFREGMEQKSIFQGDALALARSLGDPWRQAWALSGLGWDQRDYARACRYWEEAAALYREVGDWRSLASLLGILGDTVLANGDTSSAHRFLEEAVNLNRRMNYKTGMEFVLVAKSREALMTNDYASARASLQEWMEMAAELGNRMGYIWGRARLGYVALREGNLSEGHHLLLETIQDFQKTQTKVGLAFTLEKMANFFIASSLPDRAAHLIGWADTARKETGYNRPLTEQVDLDRDIEACLSKMGERTFTEAYSRGAAMKLDEIVSLASEEIH